MASWLAPTCEIIVCLSVTFNFLVNLPPALSTLGNLEPLKPISGQTGLHGNSEKSSSSLPWGNQLSSWSGFESVISSMGWLDTFGESRTALYLDAAIGNEFVQ